MLGSTLLVTSPDFGKGRNLKIPAYSHCCLLYLMAFTDALCDFWCARCASCFCNRSLPASSEADGICLLFEVVDSVVFSARCSASALMVGNLNNSSTLISRPRIFTNSLCTRTLKNE